MKIDLTMLFWYITHPVHAIFYKDRIYNRGDGYYEVCTAEYWQNKQASNEDKKL